MRAYFPVELLTQMLMLLIPLTLTRNRTIGIFLFLIDDVNNVLSFGYQLYVDKQFDYWYCIKKACQSVSEGMNFYWHLMVSLYLYEITLYMY